METYTKTGYKPAGLGSIQLKKYDPNIYWALQDNDNDGVNETLVLSREKVTGQEQGNFFKDTVFNYREEVPWIAGNFASSTNNKSYNVTTVNVEKIIKPKSTAHWFDGVGYNVDRNELHKDFINNLNYVFLYINLK